MNLSAEIVTIIIIVIAVIVTIYLSLLKKNGWIGNVSNYRCPNPECKRIFHSPMKVKDYSNKQITRIACPECGYDLGSSEDAKAVMENIIENKAEPDPQEASASIESQVSETKIENDGTEKIKQDPPTVKTSQERIPLKNHQESKESILDRKIEIEAKTASSVIEPGTLIAIKDSEETKGLEGEPENDKLLKQSKNFKKVNLKKRAGVKNEKPPGCINYFGYLWTLPRGSTTPDECYACSRLIDCYKESSV